MQPGAGFQPAPVFLVRSIAVKHWLILLLALLVIGCGPSGQGKHKESFQDIPKPEEKK